jgi:DNA-binding beta-propeller fold protein YncE
VFHIGGLGAWDYTSIDSVHHRLYVSHATEVDVIDLLSGKLVGAIPNTESARGIALVPGVGRGFIASYKKNALIVFDLRTLKLLPPIPTDARPDALTYDAVSGLLLAFTHNQTANVIRPADSKLVGRIPLKGSPEFAVPDGRGKVYVSLQDTNEIAQIDPGKLAFDHRWPTAPCTAPTSLAIDSHARRLFTGCHNLLLAILDADSGALIDSLPEGPGVDGTVFDPTTGIIFVSSGGSGQVFLYKGAGGKDYKLLQVVKSRLTGRTIALDPRTGRVYVPFAARPESGPDEGLAGTFGVLEIARHP